mmetsp:Transcript_18016/g.58832  ORF Transcript_18016/g.58832 Transcript_18016/m.58832 type:complete len:251 (+) Transcript_18016:142-894(+)
MVRIVRVGLQALESGATDAGLAKPCAVVERVGATLGLYHMGIRRHDPIPVLDVLGNRNACILVANFPLDSIVRNGVAEMVGGGGVVAVTTQQSKAVLHVPLSLLKPNTRAPNRFHFTLLIVNCHCALIWPIQAVRGGHGVHSIGRLWMPVDNLPLCATNVVHTPQVFLELDDEGGGAEEGLALGQVAHGGAADALEGLAPVGAFGGEDRELVAHRLGGRPPDVVQAQAPIFQRHDAARHDAAVVHRPEVA